MDMSDEELDQAVQEFGKRKPSGGRRIRELHVAAGPGTYLILYALCNDGTLWSRSPFGAMPEERH